VSVTDGFHRFWVALDRIVASVRSTPWGAVVTQPSTPDVWDLNYARVDAPDAVPLDEIEGPLLPTLREAGVVVEHIVSFHPDAHGDLFDALTARGHRVGSDALLVLERGPAATGSAAVEELVDPDELPLVVSSVLRDGFAVQPDAAIDQLVRLDGEVLRPAGKRWFGVRDGSGRVVSAGTLLVLGGVAYLDDVATLPASRGRGYASAVVSRIAEEARLDGADVVTLLADPEAPSVIAMYERLGFREAGRITSSRGPTPAA
jgi:ribosomal protein S18 acetylase RimI-like enzyme